LIVFTVGVVLIRTCCGCFIADLRGIISSDDDEDDLESSPTWIRRMGVFGRTDFGVDIIRTCGISGADGDGIFLNCIGISLLACVFLTTSFFLQKSLVKATRSLVCPAGLLSG
jgi:hypothetical protein